MIEVEVKLPVEDLERIKKELSAGSFQRVQLLREEDHYYDNDAQDIRMSGEALRIRKTTDLETGYVQKLITFKGKKVDKVSMTRTELETEVGDASTMHELFEALGYHEVKPAVIKVRDELAYESLHACLDEVEGLGSFLELEVVVEDDSEREMALCEIERVLKRLGYQMSDTIRTSYLTLLQRKTDQ